MKTDFCGLPFESGFLKWIHGLCYTDLVCVFMMCCDRSHRVGKPVKPLLSFYASCTCCVEHSDFQHSPQALELLYISSYLSILHPL